MKTFSTTLLLALCVYTQNAIAQCPVVYNYDNAGNRYERLPDCPGGYEMLKVDSPSTSLTDTSQNLTEALYPNPTAGPLTIVFNNTVNNAQITITDNVGRQLYNTTAGGSNIPLNIANLAQGVYYIQVKAGGQIFESSVVKN